MKEVITLHGFNVRDTGIGTVDRLNPLLWQTGHRIREFDYGWLGRLGVRLFTNRFARLLAGITWEGSVALGHSNGCHIINTALRDHKAPFSKVIYIAPALDRDIPFPNHVEKALVVWSHTDPWTKLASWIPFSDWGNMGNKGYRGPEDPRVQSVNFDELAPGLEPVKHSGYFTPPHQAYLESVIAQFLAD